MMQASPNTPSTTRGQQKEDFREGLSRLTFYEKLYQSRYRQAG